MYIGLYVHVNRNFGFTFLSILRHDTLEKIKTVMTDNILVLANFSCVSCVSLVR